MKFIIFLTAAISLSLFASCASSSRTRNAREEVIIDDGYRTTSAGEVIFDDRSLGEIDPAKAKKQVIVPETVSTINEQGATVSTTSDSAGNKSDSVCFANHPLVGCVVLKTPLRGEKEILVYAQNGTVKTLPAEKIGNIFTVSADEAARAAEITEGRNFNQSSPMFAQKPQNSMPLQPLPSSQFNIQKPLPVETAAELEQTAAAPAVSVEPANGQNEEKRETAAENRPPDGEKEN